MSADHDQELTAETYADMQQPADVAVNAEGTYVVYNLLTWLCRPSENVKSALWLADIKTKMTKQVTRGDFHDHSPKWRPGKNSIAFLSDRGQAGKGDRIYTLDLGGMGGEALPLFDDQEPDRGAENWKSKPEGKGVSTYAWSPDGSKLAFLSVDEDSPDRKKQIEDDKDDVKVYGEHWEYSRLRIMEIETRKVVTAATGDVHVNTFDWSPDGKSLCWISATTPDIDDNFMADGWLSIIDVSDNLELEYRNQLVSCKSGPSHLCWCDQGIVWDATVDLDSPISARTVYGIMNEALQDNNFHVKRLAFGDSNDAYGIQKCQQKAVVYVHNGMADELWPLGASSPILSVKNYIFSWDAVPMDEGYVTASVMGFVARPAELFISHSQTTSVMIDEQMVQLSHHSKNIADMELGTIRWLSYKTSDGVPIDGYYAIPRTLQAAFDQKQPLPTVVISHGGPHWRLNEMFAMDHMPWLMAQGYLVLMCNYRGGSGYGNDYAKAVRGNAAASFQDVIWLVKKGVEEGHVDKDRVAIHGWSQGGYMTYMAITHDADFHFAAAIPGAGVTDWATMAMTSDLPRYEAGLAGQAPWNARVADTNDRLSSPIYHMHDIKTPVLIVHGENDARVPVSQAIGFHRGMQAHGKDCEMAIYPREGHGFPVPFERAHFLDMIKRMTRFLKKHIG